MEIYIVTCFFTLYFGIGTWAIHKAFAPRWTQWIAVHVKMMTNQVVGFIKMCAKQTAAHIKTWTNNGVNIIVAKVEQLKQWAVTHVLTPTHDTFKKIVGYVKKS